MAESILPANQAPTTKAGWKFGLRIFMWVVIFLAILGIIYWAAFVRKVDNAAVNANISKASAGYGTDASSVEKLLKQSVNEIMENPLEFKKAKDYAKSTSVPIEQVLVDSAIAKSKAYGYIN